MNRIWIYQSKRGLTNNELEEINNALESFITQWAAHNKKLDARFEIKYGRFIILSVNEAEVIASGCSIDDSVRFMQELDNAYHLSLFDRLQMAYLDTNGEVQVSSFNDLDKLYHSGEIKDGTLVFDNTIQLSDQLSSAWKIPFGKSLFSHQFSNAAMD